MINLRGLNKKQKILVSKILKLSDDLIELEHFFKDKKWECESGSFKTCYRKYGLAIKFSDSFYGKTECAREYEQWLAVSRGFRKHLARIIAYKNNVLIQEAVEECQDPDSCKPHRAVMEKHWKKLSDTTYNHGHANGELKFFDWVYYRIPKYIDSNKWLPGSKRRIV